MCHLPSAVKLPGQVETENCDLSGSRVGRGEGIVGAEQLKFFVRLPLFLLSPHKRNKKSPILMACEMPEKQPYRFFPYYGPLWPTSFFTAFFISQPAPGLVWPPAWPAFLKSTWP
jgi:hypothetical protein